MYIEFFGFSEPPFSITPDPRYLYMSQRHREALAHLVYGVGEGGGFVQLTGEVGTGKTTVIRVLMEQLPENVDAALILNPCLTNEELLEAICDELGVAYDPAAGSGKALIDALNAHLLEAHAQGRRTVLIVDEAQDLSSDLLEQIRLLTNLETTHHKLLQIFLVGQPELKQILNQDNLRQVAQRITARFHLTPLDEQDTHEYIRHRLSIAGVVDPVFDDSAIRRIHQLSAGIPRVINIICDRALLGAYSARQHRVSRSIVGRATREVLGDLPGSWLPSRRFFRAVVWVLAGAVAGGGAVLAFRPAEEVPTQAAAKAEVSGGLSAPGEGMKLDAPPVEEPVPAVGPGLPSAPLETPVAVAVPEAEPEPTPVAPLSVDELLADGGTMTDTAHAIGRLFELWGVTLDKPEKGCEDAKGHGLRCLVSKGTWSTLRGLDRPAVIELLDKAGNLHQMVLTELDGNRATLQVGERRETFDIRRLDPYWYGDYMVLWREPFPGSKTLRAGVRGEGVVWLRRRLAEIEGKLAPAVPNGLFDQSLKVRVIRFQKAHGLKPDGIVGTRTYIRINDVLADPDLPRLESHRGEH